MPRARPRLVVVVAAIVASVAAPATAWADPALEPGQHFTIDPVMDGLLIGTGLGFTTTLGLVLSTGEIRPVTPAVPPSALLSFDRTAVTQTPDAQAGTISDVILWSATGFAVLDPLLSGARDGWDALLVDAVMYAESTSLTSTLTDVVKIAVRRPRPFDYAHPSATATNAELSFPSGHTSGVASVAATATYLAFVRDPRTPRPWLTLVLGTALTGFVGVERVRAGDHFPTDVIAGALLGASVGVLVPHLHRHRQEAPPVWIGAAPAPGGGGGTLTVSGWF